MLRSISITLLVLVATGTGVFPTLAGGQANPNWTNAPTAGPSPNPSHTVGNTDGGECLVAGPTVAPEGVALLGGPPPADTIVNVHLSSQDGTQDFGPTISFQPNENGDWGGTFPIPPNLAPGVYRVEAECAFEQVNGAGIPVALGGVPVVFSYENRTYTVVAEADAPDPVEAEVTFTG